MYFSFLIALIIALQPKPTAKKPVNDFCNSAEIKIQRKQYAEAIKDYDKCIAADKNNFLAYIERGKAKQKLKKYDEAASDFNEALKVNKDYFQSALLKAYAYLEAGKKKEALEAFNQSLKINPENSESYIGRGFLLLDEGKKDAALKDFEIVIAKNNNQYKANWGKGKVLQADNKHEAAIDEFNKAIWISNKSDGEVFLSRAISYAALKKHQEAVEDYRRTIDLKIQTDEVFILKARSCLAKGLADEVVKDMEYPINVKKTKNKEIFFSRASAYFQKNDWGAAAKDYGKILTIDAKDDKAYTERGKCYYLMGAAKYQLAQLDFKKAVENNPKNEEAFFGLGKVSFELNKFDEGVDALTKAIALNPAADNYYLRSKCFYKLNKTKECCADLKKALELGAKGVEKDMNSVCK